jgi:hypothetical protein
MSTIPGFVIFGGEAVPIGVGSAPSVVGSGLWHSTLSALDSLAYIGANNQILVTNSAGTDTTWITAAGDIKYAANVWTVTGLQGRAVSNAAPSNAQVLTWSTSANAWGPASSVGGALNAYGGDISSTSTSNVQFIQSLSANASGFGHGAVAPIAVNGSGAALNWVDTQVKLQDSNTTVLQLGAAATDYIALGASGPNAGLVRVGTGTLPINIIETTLSGGATPLMTLDGSGNLDIGPTTAGTGVGVNTNIFAQGAGGSANPGGNIGLFPGDGTTTGTPGSVLVSLSPPPGAGNNPQGLVIEMGATTDIQLGPLAGTSLTQSALYMSYGFTANTFANTTNYTLKGNSFNTVLSGPSEVDIAVAGGAKIVEVNSLGVFLGQPLGGLPTSNAATSALAYQFGSVPITAGANNVLTNVQVANPILLFTGACNASATAITLPGVRTEWIADFTQCTGLGSNTFTVQCPTATKTITISSNVVHRLYSDGVSSVYNLTYS